MMKIYCIRLPKLAVMVLLSGLTTFLSGCSSTPIPSAEVAGAKTALMSAESQGATQYAPVAMDRARNKLRRAEQAVKKEKYKKAKMLAEEAQADAELALAITGKDEAERAVHEMELGIEVLREEIDRAQNN